MDSPRPGTPIPERSTFDHGVYRSIFQQPILHVPPKAPSYSWFEFLLHPDALQLHLAKLKKEKAENKYTEISALELIREFLEQAQMVADEGNTGNQRYQSLLRVAAVIVMDMEITLDEMEGTLAVYYQRLLMDGLMQTGTMSVETKILHHRWVLRTVRRQWLSSPLTASKNAAEELNTGLQIALGEYLNTHFEIAKSLTNILEESTVRDSEACMDLGVYYFAMDNFQLALECFMKAEESSTNWKRKEKDQLMGYKSASEAVLALERDGKKSLKSEWKEAWNVCKWEELRNRLRKNFSVSVGNGEAILAPHDCNMLEQNALTRSREMNNDPSVGEKEKQNIRFFYAEVVVHNALLKLFHAAEDRIEQIQDQCLRTIQRLLLVELQQETEDPAKEIVDTKAINELAQRIVELFEFAIHEARNCSAHRFERVFRQLIVRHPFLRAFCKNLKLLKLLSGSETQYSVNLPEIMEREAKLRRIEHTQKEFSDSLTEMYDILDKNAIDAFFSNFTENLQSASDLQSFSNLIYLCMYHRRWDLIAQWEQHEQNQLSASPKVLAFLRFAMSMEQLLDYIHSSLQRGTEEHIELRSCLSLFANVLTAHAEISRSDNNTSEQSWKDTLAELPQWILEPLICLSAGLLYGSFCHSHKSPIAFDLTQFGEVALVIAFAPEKDTELQESDAISLKDYMHTHKADLICVLEIGIDILRQRYSREPQWRYATATLLLNPVSPFKSFDPRRSLSEYLTAASLATNYFTNGSIIQSIGSSSLIRMSQCLIHIQAHVAAAVLYQCLPSEDMNIGLKVLRKCPENHDLQFFQYFWKLPFLEVLMQLHANQCNEKAMKLLTQLIQTPEINICNSEIAAKKLRQRILKCYFQDLSRRYQMEPCSA